MFLSIQLCQYLILIHKCSLNTLIAKPSTDLIYHLGDCVRDADWLRERFFRRACRV